jgi:NADP-dependent 3-hydroxy acid dehydrogenase YdfG
MDLQDKVAIITGASSGIGAATANILNKSGVKLVLSGRREHRLQALQSELHSAAYVAGDISEAHMPSMLIKTALDTYGHCDIVFNNAGVTVMGKIEDINIDAVCQMVRINVEAAYRMAYEALKHFMAVGCGYLVNTASIVGTKVRPTSGAYAGTKHAIEALTEGLRMEVAKTNIKVACIEPGLTNTEIWRGWEVPAPEAFGIPRPLEPEDVALLVLFILEQPNHVRIPRAMIMSADQEL